MFESDAVAQLSEWQVKNISLYISVINCHSYFTSFNIIDEAKL